MDGSKLLRQPNLVRYHIATLLKEYIRNYIVERIIPQPRLLEVLRDLLVCTGVGVRREVVGIEDFYSTISGETVELNRFLDLSGMVAAAGFKLRARNMIALGVQVVGTILK